MTLRAATARAKQTCWSSFSRSSGARAWTGMPSATAAELPSVAPGPPASASWARVTSSSLPAVRSGRVKGAVGTTSVGLRADTPTGSGTLTVRALTDRRPSRVELQAQERAVHRLPHRLPHPHVRADDLRAGAAG